MPLLLIILISALLPLAYAGWGTLVFRVFKLDTEQMPRTFSVWTGWITLLVLWQAIHLVFPLTVWIVLPTLIAGFIFLRLFWKRSTDSVGGRSAWIILVILLLLMLRLVVSVRVLAPPTNYDTGLYYQQLLAWYNRFAVVPGLGNLHGRLAFNQSWFIYVAALNFHPLLDSGRSLANVTLFMLVAGTLAELILPALRKPSLWRSAHPYRYVGALLIFPMLVYFAVFYSVLSSPTPDFASHMLQLMMFTLLCVGVGRWLEGDRDLDSLAVMTSLIAVIAVTIKLSNAMFALVTVAFAGIYFWKKREKYLTQRVLLCAVLIGGIWCVHGYILSGMPLYPSTIGRLQFDWAVPSEAAQTEALGVYAWARQPEAPAEEVLANWDWFRPWLQQLLTYRLQVVLPLSVAVITLVIALLVQLRRRDKSTRLAWSLTIPVVLSLVYWFFVAPDTRFAMTLFYLLPVQGGLLCLLMFRKWLARLSWMQILAAGILGCSLALLLVVSIGIIRDSQFTWWFEQETISPDWTTAITDSGLEITIPVDSDQCWDAPLPCTPYFNPALRLRDPTDLGEGFTVH